MFEKPITVLAVEDPDLGGASLELLSFLLFAQKAHGVARKLRTYETVHIAI